ncbi:MAG: carboxyl transferase domain-containing protein, partial [Myxococcota bacterium]|nr:carboxyl transferase domain-containing protein [Myxococcota bacterium]
MSWKDEADEIARRRARAEGMGGPDAVARQHARGRLTVRERIAALVDPESFREVGATAGSAEGGADAGGGPAPFTPANVVVGTARVGGRPCVVGGDDFTLRGGAYSPAGLKKAQHADRLAIRRRIPLVRLLEGGGASISGSYAQRGRSGYDLTEAPPMNVLAMQALATVPVACAALGPCAGFPAARLVASHFSVMTRETAVVLTGGPALVERATGRRMTKEELGGSDVHLRSGVVQNVGEDEADALAQVRRFLSYLPPSVHELPPR